MQDITFISWPVRGNRDRNFYKNFSQFVFSRKKKKEREREEGEREKEKDITHGPRITIIPI